MVVMIGGVIFFLIEPNLLSQTKVETDHGFESWILGPYCRKYLSRRVEVLIHSSFLNGELVCCEDSGLDPLHKDLEEGGGVLYYFQFGGNAQPCAEILPLPSGCPVLLGGGSGQS